MSSCKLQRIAAQVQTCAETGRGGGVRLHKLAQGCRKATVGGDLVPGSYPAHPSLSSLGIVSLPPGVRGG